jgi:hypothetical protein
VIPLFRFAPPGRIGVIGVAILAFAVREAFTVETDGKLEGIGAALSIPGVVFSTARESIATVGIIGEAVDITGAAMTAFVTPDAVFVRSPGAMAVPSAVGTAGTFSDGRAGTVFGTAAGVEPEAAVRAEATVGTETAVGTKATVGAMTRAARKAGELSASGVNGDAGAGVGVTSAAALTSLLAFVSVISVASVGDAVSDPVVSAGFGVSSLDFVFCESDRVSEWRV